MYKVPSTKYEVYSEARAKKQEIRLHWVVLRDSYGFRIFTSSFNIRRSAFEIKKYQVASIK